MTQDQINQLLKLQDQIERRSAYLDAKAKALNAQQRRLEAGIVPNMGAADLEANLKNNPNLSSGMVPGNVGAINRVIWPFYFSTQFMTLAPNTTINSGFTITQEAAFIWMSYTKSAYIYNAGATSYTYVDPDQAGATGMAPGLSFTIHDSQSGRDFDNFPINLDGVGNPRFPTIFPKPTMFLPNSNIQISFNNSDPSVTYCPFITAFGYRVRIDDAQNILSLVFA